jgi:Fem-1 family protein b
MKWAIAHLPPPWLRHCHLDMTIYLIDELNYDVNPCDNDGRSALYDPVYCKSLELLELLLKRGARNIRATLDQMSPLMWAAEKRCRNLVDAIASHCSLLERIEAEELFGSAIVCTLYDDRNLEEAFQCFYRALELRLMHNLPKVLRMVTTEIFDNRQECQTLEELEENRSNLDYMYTEALLIRERLLGPADKKYHDSLAYRGAVLADEGKYVKALLIWMFELRLRQKYSISFESKQLREIVSLISEILYQSISIPSDALLTLLALMNEELEHHKNDFDYNLYTMLFLNTITAHVYI